MRCPKCGNDNPGDNRFCGMCGATLLEPQSAATQTQRAAPAIVSAAPNTTTSRPSVVEPPRASSTSAAAPASISGPSFLGLNNPPPASHKGSGLSIDPHSSSRNLEYLLDDEEEPRGSGAGKVFLILIALLLAGGFGYLRWKGQPLPWLGSGSNKPSATATNPAPTDSTSSTPPSITPDPAPSAPAASAPAQSSDASTNSSNPPASATNTPPASTPASTPVADSKPSSPSSSATSGNSTPATKKSANADSTDSADNADDAEQPAAKPTAAPKPARPVDTVAEAHKYLYGQGARQDCDRGMRLLKPAANAGNVKAMAEMGALYSAGLCTPHDLPTAYHWFAIALRKDPGNQTINSDLQKLWGEMTQPERQLAMKQTQ